jgi:hypothetical protein
LTATVVPSILVLRRGGIVTGTLLIALTLSLAGQLIRGYEVHPGSLVIRRVFRSTRWPLALPTRAEVRPSVMANSWRLWGNGGFFAFSGIFSNAALGKYRAFVTDFARTVVLDTPRGRLVVSPDDPEAFIAAIKAVTSRDE